MEEQRYDEHQMRRVRFFVEKRRHDRRLEFVRCANSETARGGRHRPAHDKDVTVEAARRAADDRVRQTSSTGRDREILLCVSS
nr:MAG: hypothetical protein DIU78_05505 [Pseudomonadota bacterium]